MYKNINLPIGSSGGGSESLIEWIVHWMEVFFLCFSFGVTDDDVVVVPSSSSANPPLVDVFTEMSSIK
jgi:hypothetical protein